MMRWNKNWKLIVNYRLIDNSFLKTSYNLYESPYLELWIAQWKKYTLRSSSSIYSWFINKNKSDLPDLVKEISQVLKTLKQQSNANIPDIPETLTQEEFNKWHSIFEQNVHLAEGSTNALYMELNSLIHTLESVFNQTNSQLFYRSIIGVLGHNETLPFKPEYQCFSHHNETWGDLVMSYATTGKNWIEVSSTNDLELVREKGITNKSLLHQEFIANFIQSDFINVYDHLRQTDQLKEIYYWYESLPDDLKQNVPIDNLNELYFRNLFLGYIEVHKLPEVNYSKYLDSNAYRRSYQKKFNLEYFGKVKTVESVIFENQLDKNKTFKISNYE